jgi:hypothetical protein
MTTLGGTGAPNICNPSLGGTANTGARTQKKTKPPLQQVPRAAAGQSFVIKAHRHSDLDHVSSDEEEDEKVNSFLHTCCSPLLTSRITKLEATVL